MNTPPFFSIIIPTYNRSKFVAKSIQSILDQDYNFYEIIVVDDGSTDDTKNIVNSFKSEKIIYRWQKNSERGAARNHGIQLSKGDYITFLDSDDVLYKNYFTTAVKAIKKFNYPEICNLGYEIINSITGEVIKINNFEKGVNSMLPEGNILSCHAVFVRRDICKEYKFKEDRELAGMEDWEYWLRLASRYTIWSSPEISSAMIQHESRSVINISKESLVLSCKLLIHYAFENKYFEMAYKKKKRVLFSSLNSYISLHLALTKRHRKEALKYLLISLIYYPRFIFKRRFYAIIKHLI